MYLHFSLSCQSHARLLETELLSAFCFILQTCTCIYTRPPTSPTHMLTVKLGISGYALAESFHVYNEASYTLLSCIQTLFTKRAM